MKNRKRFLRFVFVILLVIAELAVGELLWYVIRAFGGSLAGNAYAVDMIINLVIGFLTILLLLLFHRCVTKFSLKGLLYGIFVYALPLLVFYAYHIFESVRWLAVNAPNAYETQFKGAALPVLLDCLTVGFAEELVFRSGLLNFLLPAGGEKTKRRAAAACVYAGFLFGASHLISLLTEPEAGLSKILLTVLLGSLLGYVFSVIFLKTKNILSVIILHAMWDFTTMCNTLMIHNKYAFGGSYDFIRHQLPVIALMAVIASALLLKSEAEELFLDPPV